MKETTSNTHVATAKFRQEGVHEQQGYEGATDATMLAAVIDAQVEATLAVAYEQRTANLISLMSLRLAVGAPFGEIEKSLMERLGL